MEKQHQEDVKQIWVRGLRFNPEEMSGITISLKSVGKEAVKVFCLMLLCVSGRGAQPPILFQKARPSEHISAKVCVAPPHPAQNITISNKQWLALMARQK